MQKVDPMEKIIAVQNEHSEKLNQLENLLTRVIKKIDNDESTKKKDDFVMRPRLTTLANELRSPHQNNSPPAYSV